MIYLRKFFYMIVFLIMGTSLGMAIFLPNLLAYDPNKNWINPILKIAIALCFLLLIFGLNNIVSSFNKKQKKIFVAIISIIAISLQIYISFAFRNQPLTDDNSVKLQAFDLVNGTKIWPDYFSVFPNNVNVTIFYAAIIKFLYFFTRNAVVIDLIIIILKFVLVDVLVLLGFKILQDKSSHDNTMPYMFVVLCALFLPFYCYPIYFYTDPLIIVFPILSLYLYKKLKISNTLLNEYIYGCLLFLTLIIGVLLKQNFIVFVIAYFVYETFQIRGNLKAKISKSILILLFCAAIGVSSSIGQSLLRKSVGYETNQSLKMPSTFWIYMGLNPNLQGQFSLDDQNQVMSETTYSDKQKVTSDGIKSRISQMGLVSTCKHFFKKMQTLVSIGSMDGMMYFPVTTHSPIWYRQGIHKIEFLIDNVNQIIYLSILSMVTGYSLLQLFKKKNFELIDLVNLGIIGIILFHTLLWESESRYFLLAAPFLLLSGTYSMNYFRKYYKNNVYLTTTSRISIPIVLIIMAFGSMFMQMKGLLKSDNYVVTSQRTGVFDDFMVTVPKNAILKQKFVVDQKFNQVVIGVAGVNSDVFLTKNGQEIEHVRNTGGNVVINLKHSMSAGKYQIVIVNNGSSVKWHGPVESKYFKLFDYPVTGLKQKHIYPTFSVNYISK